MKPFYVLFLLDALLLAAASLFLIADQQALSHSVFAALFLFVIWQFLLYKLVLAPAHAFRIQWNSRKHHYVQTSLQLCLYVYWGLYWLEVGNYVPLLIVQLIFAYLFEMLLSWSRGKEWHVGFGQFPIVLSLNLFLWFREEYFFLQFLLVALTYLGKEFVTWRQDGKRKHIFNPSGFSLSLVSVGLMLGGASELTRGVDIITAFVLTPSFYEVVFLLGLVVMLLFRTTFVTLGAALALCLFYLGAGQILGRPIFLVPIDMAVFLGITLLVTDPSTSPKTETGKFIYGLIYGTGIFFTHILLRYLGQPGYFDKILMVPVVNLLTPTLDRVSASVLWRMNYGFRLPVLPYGRIAWVAFYAAFFVFLLPILKNPPSSFKSPLPGSVVRMSDDLGKMLYNSFYCRKAYPDAYRPFGFSDEISNYRTLTKIYRGELRRQVTAQSKIRNVLLISIDTCRADHFGCYGYPGSITPHIDAFAQEGFLFENVLSSVPITLPSHCSMLTGTTPLFHGVHDNLDFKLAEDNRTLAETLQEKGFTTGAIVSAFPLDSRFGLDQGFDTYMDEFDEASRTRGLQKDRLGEVTSRLATDWLSHHHVEPFFLFVHYFDPHTAYDPPQPFAARFPESPYAAEIAYTDYCIGQVLAKVKELGLYDSTLIIITSDHGEGLGEHGEGTHAYFIYQSTLRVPLIVRLPGQRKPQRIPRLVGLIDIVPTVSSLLDIAIPGEVQGIDLSPCFQPGGGPSDPRHLYCECYVPASLGANPLLGVVTDKWKFIHNTRPELYDLSTDPQELNDLISQESEQARVLDEHLQRIVQQQTRDRSTTGELELDDEALRRLQSLGYVGGGNQEMFEFDPNREDAKDLLIVNKAYGQAISLVNDDELEDAYQIIQELLDDYPNFVRGHVLSADIARRSRKYELAAQHLTEAIALQPWDSELHLYLGHALRLQGKIVESASEFQRAVELDPENADTMFILASVLRKMGKFEDAIAHYRQGLRVEPDDVTAGNALAWILAAHPNVKLRDTGEAIKLAERAVELTQRENPQFLDTLAVAYAANNQFQLAIAAAQEAIELTVQAGSEERAKEVSQRVELYRMQKPYRAPAPENEDEEPR